MVRGVPSEVLLDHCAVNLHHAVTVSQKHLGRRVARLTRLRMREICSALRFSVGCDAE